jgi:hypothetical protein
MEGEAREGPHPRKRMELLNLERKSDRGRGEGLVRILHACRMNPTPVNEVDGGSNTSGAATKAPYSTVSIVQTQEVTAFLASCDFLDLRGMLVSILWRF